MARYTPVKVSTQELAALAFAAFRMNTGHIYKDANFYDKEKDAVIAVTPNKILMRDNNLQVTEQDREQAIAAIDVLTKDRTMRILKGQPIADFQNTLTNLVLQPEATMSDAGLMAFLPNMSNQIVARQAREEEIAGLSQVSEYLGKVGDKVQFNLTVMTSRWSDQYNCWLVNGKDANDNLIGFFTTKQDCTKNGTYTAKIKRIEQSRYHNGAKVTTVNFVKPL